MQPANKYTARNTSLLLEVIFLAGFFVRVWGLSSYAYNGDEMQFIIIAKADTLAEIWRRGLLEIHPPLMQFIRHYLLMVDGDIFTQRLFSVMSGMVSIAMMYRIGILLRSTALGVFSALCMAFFMVAVSTSMVIRDYAFFMPVILAVFYFYVRYQNRHYTHDLLGFAVFLFIACALNFTAFIVAAACGLCEGWQLIKTRNSKALLTFCLSFVPIAALGIFFYLHYLAPGTTGPMWTRLATESGAMPSDFFGRLKDTFLNVYYFFVPFAGTRSIPTTGAAAKVLPLLMLPGGFFLMGLYYLGLRRAYGKAPTLVRFILLLWCVAISLSLLNFYPFLASRHSFYLLPFFILPLGYLLDPLMEKILKSPVAARASAMIILFMAVIMGASGIYIHFVDELSLKQSDLTAGQKYLLEHLKPGDAIVTGGSAAYFYMRYEKENGSHAYNEYETYHYFNHSKVLAGFDAPFKAHRDWQPVQKELAEEVDSHIVPPHGKFWFVQYGWKNEEIWRIMECPALHDKIADFMSREGVAIFSLKETDFAAFLHNDKAWQQCFTHYKPLVIGLPFHEVVKP